LNLPQGSSEWLVYAVFRPMTAEFSKYLEPMNHIDIAANHRHSGKKCPTGKVTSKQAGPIEYLICCGIMLQKYNI